MTIDCAALRNLVSRFSLVKDCDVVRNNVLRITTPFEYPDSSNIDLFLKPTDAGYVLSDFGQTTANLLDVHVKPWTTEKRKRVVRDICGMLGVENDGGELILRFPASDLPQVSTGIVRLAQACIRISDLVYTQRLRVTGEFRENFEEFIEATDLPYEASTPMPGEFGNTVEVDFNVHGPRVKSLVLTLSTANVAAAHGLANEVFRKWYDLQRLKSQYQFLSVFDSTNNVFKDEDLARLKTASSVLAFPADQDQIQSAIAA